MIMNESIKNLLERRSIRAYKKRACSERNSGYDPGSGSNIPPAAWDSRALLW